MKKPVELIITFKLIKSLFHLGLTRIIILSKGEKVAQKYFCPSKLTQFEEK